MRQHINDAVQYLKAARTDMHEALRELRDDVADLRGGGDEDEHEEDEHEEDDE